MSLALKPDGGELVAFNFDAGSISIIETTPNEVLGSYLVGAQPTRGVFSLDNARLYISNFGSEITSRSTISILGKVVAYLPVGTHPDALALSQNQNYLLVVDSGSSRCGSDPETHAEEKIRALGVLAADDHSRWNAAEPDRREIVSRDRGCGWALGETLIKCGRKA